MTYSTTSCSIPVGDTEGWEAAVFDHYQAVVTAICSKLERGVSADTREEIGGSTYSFHVWDEHPMQEEVLGLLGRFRQQARELRERVATYNVDQNVPDAVPGASWRMWDRT